MPEKIKKLSEYRRKYVKEHYSQVLLYLNKSCDEDIIDKLSTEKSKAAYIKKLIRQDIRRNPEVTEESTVRRGRKKHEDDVACLIRVGDTVYSTANGKPMKVLRKDEEGFETEDDYFRYDEHRKLFWLASRSYEQREKIKKTAL